MAGQKKVALASCSVALPPFGTYSVSFWFFPLVRLVGMAFFFFCFFVLENNFKTEQRTTPDTEPLSKQRFVLIVVDFANQFPELLKMVFDNVVQIRINRELVDTHNVCKPVKCFVMFLPYID